MDKQRVFRRSLIAAATAMALFAGNAMAQTVPLPETEPNNQMSEAQSLELVVNGSLSVDGVIGTLFGQAVNDVDFFSFEGQAGDVVTLDIDGGMGGQRDVDTVLHLFGPGISIPIFSDDEPADEGSTADGFDARITNFTLPATGKYTVAVSGVPVYLDQYGGYDHSLVGFVGDYTLVVSLTRAEPGPIGDPGPLPGPVPGPVVQPASIEIKTSGELVRGSRREIFVALLSSADFDPRNVDVTSLSFTLGDGRADGFKRCSKHGWRINRDNRRDLVCHFSTDVNVPAGDVDAVVKGKMKGATGYAFEGKGKVKVIDRHAGRRDRDDDRRRGRDRD
jgi:Bacterial pre-peptidase C-terminal domain